MFAKLRHYVILLRSLVQSDSCVTVPNNAVLVDGRMFESFEVTTGVLKGEGGGPRPIFPSLSS